MSVYTLPELTYDYAALEPHISARIMELHHSKHHAAYVAGANAALEQMEEARATNAFGNINKLEKDLAFHLGGHINHSIFWTNLSPNGADRPSGELAAAIDEVKKYFNSKMPREVDMYLFAVTRDTVDSCIEIASATVFRLSGRRYWTPCTKNASCCFTISAETFRMVRARWSSARTIAG